MHPAARTSFSRVAGESTISYCWTAVSPVPHSAAAGGSRVVAERTVGYCRAAALVVPHPGTSSVSRVAGECTADNRRAAFVVMHSSACAIVIDIISVSGGYSKAVEDGRGVQVSTFRMVEDMVAVIAVIISNTYIAAKYSLVLIRIAILPGGVTYIRKSTIDRHFVYHLEMLATIAYP